MSNSGASPFRPKEFRGFVIPTEGRNLLVAGGIGAASGKQIPRGFAARNDKKEWSK
jgi:hypothetical protein